MILFALWLITSTVHTQMAVYPSLESCSIFAAAETAALNKPPRPVLGTFLCVPVVITGQHGEQKQGFGI